MRPVAAFPILALVLLCCGCASAPFVRGAKQYAPAVTAELRAYLDADAALDVSTRADRLRAADALDASVNADMVTLDSVREAWPPVREPYTIYVDADADLDAQEKALRAGNIARFDRLIQVESGRWIYGGGHAN